MHIGISGSRYGSTPAQHTAITAWIKSFTKVFRRPLFFHHGDCVGVDSESHNLARSYGYYVVVHPPLNPVARAFCQNDHIETPYSYLKRNRHIVDACDIMLIVPNTREFPNFDMSVRGGTWYTYRYAMSKSKTVLVIWPNGNVQSNIDEQLPS